MIRRLFVSLLAVLFTWTSVTAPARAFAPPVVPLPLMFTAVTPAGAVALGAAIAVGMVVGAIMAEDAATGQKVTIPTNPQSQNQPAAPSAPSTAQPTPTTQYYVNHSTCVSQSLYASDMDTACSQCASAVGVIDPHIYSGYQCRCYQPGHSGEPAYECVVGNIYTQQVNACPSGYTSSGSSCVLSDARAAQPDGKIDYFYNGQSINPASLNDADLSNSSLYVNSNANGTQVQIVGKDENGNPKQLVMVPQPDGGMKVQINTGTSSGTSAGTITQTQFITDSTGTVTSVQTSTASGQVSYDPNTGGATLTSNPTLQNPDGTISTLPQAQPQLDIQFPNDYNREATQTAISNDVKTMKDKLDNTEQVDDPVLPQSQQFDDAFFKDTFVGLLSWQLPVHSSSCPVGSFTWNTTAYSIDAHCQLVNDHWSLLSQAMAVVWLIAALFVVMRA